MSTTGAKRKLAADVDRWVATPSNHNGLLRLLTESEISSAVFWDLEVQPLISIVRAQHNHCHGGEYIQLPDIIDQTFSCSFAEDCRIAVFYDGYLMGYRLRVEAIWER